MKKRLAITFLALIFAAATMPSFALKVKNPIVWGVMQKTKIESIDNALEIVATVDRIYAPVYVVNLNCHEFSRSYFLKSTNGQTYVRPRKRTVRISREPSVFLKKLFDQNEGNIYFKAYGFGLFGNFVGEFFIGDKSVNRILIEKGYCDYFQ